MTKDIKDYLHYYLGQEIETPDGIGWLASVSRDRRGINGLILSDIVKVDFRTIRHTKNSIDGYDRKRNSGCYLINQQGYVGINAPKGTEPDFIMPGGCKPLLRPLASMTEEEAYKFINKDSFYSKHFVTHCEQYRGAVYFKVVYNNGKSRRWSKNIPFNSCQPEQFHYLLQQGFDLFGLIESGLAIEKSKTK